LTGCEILGDAMSQENVEIVRRIFEAGAHRDGAATLTLYDHAVVWDVSRLGGADFGTGVFHGHDGLRRWFREWYAAWENTQNDLDELIDAGEYVVSVMTQRGRGRASGIEVDLEQYAVWSIRDGKVVHVIWFLTRKEAYEAVGLRE
jgi:ketosteroid isomerase-like protein